jgi:aspartate/methionine/tyrosine aminotransferase
MYGQLVINTISCAPTFAQIGAVEAIRGGQEPMAEMVAEFRARRDLVVAGLNEIPGIECLTPRGAFYAFPRVSGTGLSGKELADRLLAESGVCVLAGTAFGGIGSDHVRISYANSRENLTKALGRIRDFVGAAGAETAIAGSAR